jgi:putative transposase
MSTRAVIDLFHRLHLTLLRPRYIPAKGDAKKKEWFKEALTKFIQRIGPNDRVLFLDEASIKWSATLSRMWAEIGHQPLVPQIGGRKGLHLIGAVDPQSDKGWFSIISQMKAPNFIEFLTNLLSHYPTERIYLIIDNARVHHAKIVQEFVNYIQSRLRLIFLPPYSADLNPIERFWEYLRQEKTHNTFYATFPEFETNITQFIGKFQGSCGIIKNLCNFYDFPALTPVRAN